MADTTVEIYNNTIPWAGYTNNAQTLITTDASTRYVIKDVEIDSNGYNSTLTPSLKINNTKVATLSGNLSGSEIMDINSTLSISLPDTSSTYFTLNGTYSNQAYQGLSTNNNADAYFSGSLAAPATSTNSLSSVSTFTNGATPKYCWTVGSDFYYFAFDGNSSTALYRRAGGPNGTETVIFSNSYSPICFDGVSKFYCVLSGTLYSYNTVTNTATSLGINIGSGTTYPVLAYCNGFLFWFYTYSSNSMQWYHIATGNNGTTSCANYGSSVGWSVFYDSSASVGQYRVIHLPNNGSYGTGHAYSDFTVNSAGNSLTSYSYGSLSTSISYTGSMSSTGNKYAIMLGSSSNASSIYVVDKSMGVISSKNINVSGGYGFNTIPSTVSIISTPSTAQQNALGPSLKLRVTGIKQT